MDQAGKQTKKMAIRLAEIAIAQNRSQGHKR